MNLCKAVGVGALIALLYVRRQTQRRVNEARRRLGVFRFAGASNIGARRSNEDRFTWSLEPRHKLAFAAVLDGHGGTDAADFASSNLCSRFLRTRGAKRSPSCALEKAFVDVDKGFAAEVEKGNLNPSGTTAVAAVIMEDSLIVAGAGDCRAILSTRGKASSLAVEHSPSIPSEKDRISALGAFIDADGYLGGEIAVTRSLGDGHLSALKTSNGGGPLIPNPEVTVTPPSEDTEFVVLASDGLWMRDETVVSLVRQSLRQHNCPQRAVDALVEAAARDSCSKDNVTAVLVCFHQEAPRSLAPPRRRQSRLFASREQA